MQLHADKAITLNCQGSCPYVIGGIEDWEFGETKSGDEIRACADAILNYYDDVPVRSFVLTLAERRIRDCLGNPSAPCSPNPARHANSTTKTAD